jgi:hypothetical protein
MKNHDEITADDLTPIVDALVAKDKDLANRLLNNLCCSIRALKQFEAFHIAITCKRLAKERVA